MPEFKVTLVAKTEEAKKALEKFIETGEGIERAFKKGDGAAKQFTGTIGILQSRLPKLQEALLNATDPKQIERLNNIIAQTQGRIAGLTRGTQSLGGAAANVGINFGRIAQDASFGFLGIANNIEPLVLSFKSLRAQSTSTGAAFKSFFSSLAGPAGVGVLIGVLQLIDAYVNKYGIFRKKTEEAAKAQKDLTDTFNQYRDSVGKSIAELERLRTTVQNGNLPLQARVDAVKQLQSQYPVYFGNLTQEQILAGKVGDAYKELGFAINLAARARAAQDVNSKIYADNLRLEESRAKVLFKTEQELNELRSKPLPQTIFLDKGERITGQQQRQNEFDDLAKRREAALNLIDTALQRNAQRIEFYNNIINKGAAAEATISDARRQAYQEEAKTRDKLSKDALKTAQKDIEEQKKLYERYAEELRKINFGQAGVAQPTRQLGIEEQLRLELSQLRDMQQAATDKSGWDALQMQIMETQQQLDIFTSTATQALPDNDNFFADLIASQKAYNETLKDAQQLQGLFAQQFQALASGQNPIKSLTNSIKALVIQLLSAAAAAAVLAALTGGASIGLGKGASFGAKFGKIFGGLTGLKLAEGGVVFGPTRALFGEAGPEAVIPLSELPRLVGQIAGNAGGGNTVVTGAIRGNDIYLTNQNAGASYARLFG